MAREADLEQIQRQITDTQTELAELRLAQEDNPSEQIRQQRQELKGHLEALYQEQRQAKVVRNRRRKLERLPKERPSQTLEALQARIRLLEREHKAIVAALQQNTPEAWKLLHDLVDQIHRFMHSPD